MTNTPKRRGTAAETAVVRYVAAHGFPWAERLTLTGRHDRGDVSLVPGRAVVVEVKNHASAGTGQPGPGLLSDWLGEAEAERVNAGADYCPLVVKRKGTADVGAWFAYLPIDAFANLVGAPAPGSSGSVCTTVASLLALLRGAGYGHPLHADEGR